jgi:glycosyltransferase involved in cell wall biosynthesis
MLARGLRELGHEVAVSAFSGLSGADIYWSDMLVMPSGQMQFGVDMLIPHINRWAPDLTITLMDFWKLGPIASALQNYNVAAWLPIDCTPMSKGDLSALLQSRAHPIAMSQFGKAQILAAQEKMGPVVRDPFYAPHMVDMDQFSPMDDRDAFREELGLADAFVVGLCAANKDAVRKAFPEQFQAFSLLHRKHPKTVLLVHATAQSVSGLDLVRLAESMDIADAIRFTDQYTMDSGLFDEEMMRRWYNALDALMLCSYGEGFGIPAIEAQACGTPVVASDHSALTELCDIRQLVQTDPFWNYVHEAWWGRPRPHQIFRRLNRLHERTTSQRAGDGWEIRNRHYTRLTVQKYDVNTVMNLHWKSIVEELV